MFAALVAIYFVYSRVFLLPGNCEVRSKVRRVTVCETRYRYQLILLKVNVLGSLLSGSLTLIQGDGEIKEEEAEAPPEGENCVLR